MLLRRSEERYRLFVEAVQDYAIFMLDPEGCIITWNIGAERIKGYKPSEIVGQHFSRFYPEEDIRAGKPRWELEVAKQRRPIGGRGLAASQRRVKILGQRNYHSQSGIARVICSDSLKVTRDFTDRMVAQKSLEEDK